MEVTGSSENCELFFSGVESKCFFRVFKGFGGVFMCLFGELVRGKVVAFAVGRCCGLVGVSCLIVIFGGAVVWALRHGVVLHLLDAASLGSELSYRPIHPPSSVRTVPVT